MKTCKSCGCEIIIKYQSFCEKCRAIRDREQRKEARDRMREKVLAMPPVRRCRKCGEVAEHFKGVNHCKACHGSVNKKPLRVVTDETRSWMDDLIRKGRERNINLKIRPATEKRILEGTMKK